MLERLDTYPQLGNVRQLEMVLGVALAFMEPEETRLSDEFLDELEAEPAVSGTLQASQEILIRQALEQHEGKVTAAAEMLGISLATLYRWLIALGLS